MKIKQIEILAVLFYFILLLSDPIDSLRETKIFSFISDISLKNILNIDFFAREREKNNTCD